MTDCPNCVEYEGLIGRCVEHKELRSLVVVDDFADSIFKAARTMGEADDLVYQLLNELIGDDGWVDCSWDYYDRSLEAYGVPPEAGIKDEKIGRLWALGFLRFWLNHTDGTETLYQRDHPATHRASRHAGDARHDNHDHHELVRLRARLAELEDRLILTTERLLLATRGRDRWPI